MSHAESITPVHQAAPARLPANHLADTLLPVKPALVDRGSAARIRPGMVDDLLSGPDVLAAVLSSRQGLVQGSNIALIGARELLTELKEAGSTPELVVYLGSALPAADLPAGTELLLFVLPEPVEPGTGGIPADAAWAGIPGSRRSLDPHLHRLVRGSQCHHQLARCPHALPPLRNTHAGGSRRLGAAVSGGQL
ncbi:hypothetical protein QFZ57_002357 [Arthrobacter sp. B1I2]|nr:hypothetical protein [Arthrobacter sp. B1I2]